VLVGAAPAGSLPPSYLALQAWLDNHAFQITPDWTVFAVPTALVLLVALLTISYHIIKAARLNPVESLRTES
jgi:putative ABC transport system permease protein